MDKSNTSVGATGVSWGDLYSYTITTLGYYMPEYLRDTYYADEIHTSVVTRLVKYAPEIKTTAWKGWVTQVVRREIARWQVKRSRRAAGGECLEYDLELSDNDMDADTDAITYLPTSGKPRAQRARRRD